MTYYSMKDYKLLGFEPSNRTNKKYTAILQQNKKNNKYMISAPRTNHLIRGGLVRGIAAGDPSSRVDRISAHAVFHANRAD